MHNVSGITGCGPLFKDIMLLLHKGKAEADFPEPIGLVRTAVCPQSGLNPTDFCPGVVREVFIAGTEPQGICPHHRREGEVARAAAAHKGAPTLAHFAISFPRDGDIFKVDPVLRKEHQRIKLRAAIPSRDGIAKVEWWINGDKVGETGSPFSFFWNLRPGSYTIKATAVRDGAPLESPPVKILVLT
jgi:penicillin-binding protein 1C